MHLQQLLGSDDVFLKRVKAAHQTIWSDNPYVEIGYLEYVIIHK